MGRRLPDTIELGDLPEVPPEFYPILTPSG
jgi:hypothetical protein